MSPRIRDLVGGLVRYGLVGVANAATYYATYLLVHPHASYLVAHAIGLGTAMVVSFFLNCRVTFRVRPTLMRFLLYPASQVVNVVATTAGVVGLVEIGTDQRLAPLIAAALAVPASFLAARLLMTRGARDPERSTTGPAPTGPAPTGQVTNSQEPPAQAAVVPPLAAAVLRALDDPELAQAATRPLPELSAGPR